MVWIYQAVVSLRNSSADLWMALALLSHVEFVQTILYYPFLSFFFLLKLFWPSRPNSVQPSPVSCPRNSVIFLGISWVPESLSQCHHILSWFTCVCKAPHAGTSSVRADIFVSPNACHSLYTKQVVLSVHWVKFSIELLLKPAMYFAWGGLQNDQGVSLYPLQAFINWWISELAVGNKGSSPCASKHCV